MKAMILLAFSTPLVASQAYATTCDPTRTLPLRTGTDADGDGADDHWQVTRPDGTIVAAPVLSTPAAGWRGSASLAPETGPLGTARYPVLGDGRWIGYDAKSAQAGTYTFTFTFEVEDFQTLWLVGEWAADDRVHVRVNGIDTQLGSNEGASPPLPFLHNFDGPDATCADPVLGHVMPTCDDDPDDPCRPYMCEDTGAEARELHLAIASSNLAPWLVDEGGQNTLSIEVENLSGAVGLLITGGDGTTLPGGAAIQECRPTLDFGDFALPDMDGDGVADPSDACPTSYDPDQTDTDGDGFGDICDRCALDPINDGDWDSVCASEGDCDDRDDTTFTGAPENPDDGVDNDCDGKVDEAAGGEDCHDAMDNDGDLLTDCFDPDCCEFIECYQSDSNQPPDFQVCEHDCEDGADNEPPSGDGLADCEDPDCCVDPTSPCSEDNDGDGFSECEGDCADVNPNMSPGWLNDCGGDQSDYFDNDCDGLIDEDFCDDGCGCSSGSLASGDLAPMQIAAALGALALLARRRRLS